MARPHPPHAPRSLPTASWIHGPATDVLIGAGGWTLPLLALTAFAVQRGGVDVAFAFSVLTLVCNHPHYMATLQRAYADGEVLARHRWYSVHVTLLMVLVLIAAHALPSLRPVLFSTYIFWSPWHYTSQNFGLALLFARRRGVAPTRVERRVLSVGFAASYVVWLLMVQSHPSDDPYVFSLAIPPVIANAMAAPLAVLLLAAIGSVAIHWARHHGIRPMLPALLLCVTQALWFVAPWCVAVVGGPASPSVYYTTGVLAFMHCAQYLWITSYIARRAARTEGQWQRWRYAIVLILGGIALFIPGPWIASTIGGVDLRESAIIFTAVVNIHHFILDGVLWKLRDRRVAAVLLAESGAADVPAVAGVRPVRPALQWVLAGALLVVAGIDLTQRYLTRDVATEGAVSLAHALNPHDSRVDVRRAAVLAGTSRRVAAIDTLRPIVASNPHHAPAQRLFAMLLIADGQWSAANEHYRTLERIGALDAAGYVNLGVLHVRSGDAGGAEAAFVRALAFDPDLADAHLNLAETYWQRDRPADAIGHYARYLALADPRDREGQRVYLAAALKLAEAYARTGNRADALMVLARTAQAAERSAMRSTAALARARAAELRARTTARP